MIIAYLLVLAETLDIADPLAERKIKRYYRNIPLRIGFLTIKFLV